MSSKSGELVQKVPNSSARAGSMNLQQAGVDKQMSLIGGIKRNKKRRKIFGGAGTITPATITPPVPPNNGGSAESQQMKTDTYGQLAGLYDSTYKNGEFDNTPVKTGGRKIRKNKSNKRKKTTKRKTNKRRRKSNTKRRNYK